MKYLLNYTRWVALYEAREFNLDQKDLILLSGPSASGKTYFAMNQLGAKHWYDDLDAETVLVGTDNFNNPEVGPAFIKLVEEAGMPTLAKIAAETDSPHVIKLYDDKFKEWEEEASPEEKSKYEEIERIAGYDPEKCKSTIRKMGGRQGDGRVSAMAWAAALLSAKTILFDDVGDAIKNYYDSDKIKDVLIFTPLDKYLENIISRNNSENTTEHIDTSDQESGIYQYLDWYQAVDEPDLDDKKYTSDEIKSKLEEAGYSNTEEILNKFEVTDSLKDGFYIGLKDWVKPNRIINSRDAGTGRAESAAGITAL
jgi:hypothetical protein